MDEKEMKYFSKAFSTGFNLKNDDYIVHLIEQSKTSNTEQMNFTQVASTMYLAKTIERASNEIIKSNEKISHENERREKILTRATIWIAIFAGIQVALFIFNILNNIFHFWN